FEQPSIAVVAAAGGSSENVPKCVHDHPRLGHCAISAVEFRQDLERMSAFFQFHNINAKGGVVAGNTIKVSLRIHGKPKLIQITNAANRAVERRQQLGLGASLRQLPKAAVATFTASLAVKIAARVDCEGAWSKWR